MRILFSDHANGKLVERRLPREKVLKTVAHPDVWRPGRNGREELFRKFGRNHLKVVIARAADAIVVVTAHWVAQAPRA